MKNRCGRVFQARICLFRAPQVVATLYPRVSRVLFLRIDDERSTVTDFNHGGRTSHRIRSELVTDVEIGHPRIRNRRILFDVLDRVKLTLMYLRLGLDRKLDSGQWRTQFHRPGLINHPINAAWSRHSVSPVLQLLNRKTAVIQQFWELDKTRS